MHGRVDLAPVRQTHLNLLILLIWTPQDGPSTSYLGKETRLGLEGALKTLCPLECSTDQPGPTS